MLFNKNNLKNIIIGAVIAFTCFFCFRVFEGIRFLANTRKVFFQNQTKLLCQSDYQSLLDSCRELSKRVLNKELEPGEYKVRDAVNKDALQLPLPLLELNPTYVDIGSDGSVMVFVERLGPFAYFGVRIYPDKSSEPGNMDDLVRLIDGLFYFDDNYNKDDLAYKRKIDSMIEKGKIRTREQRQ